MGNILTEAVSLMGDPHGTFWEPNMEPGDYAKIIAEVYDEYQKTHANAALRSKAQQDYADVVSDETSKVSAGKFSRFQQALDTNSGVARLYQ